MKKSIIVAMSKNRVIGINNQLPWDMPADMRYFKRMTIGCPIIMGRKTFESMGKKPLPGRNNIILMRTPPTSSPQGCDIACELKEAFEKAAKTGAKEIFVIGGGRVYEQALPMVDTLYITEIDAHIQGDTYFPDFDRSQWQEVNREKHTADAQHNYDYAFVTYTRKKT
ncbi:MAG: dihydrofolate reductase [Bacteroidota bacterium]